MSFVSFVGDGAACFQGFSCCDASLRHEGCFFPVAGLPKLASEQAGYGEETTGVALCIAARVLLVFVTMES